MAGQLWVTNSLGGFAYTDELSEVLRLAVQPLVKFRQFCDAKDATEKGLNKGENYHWNVYSDIAQQGTSLIETNTMPESNFVITQGTLTLNEFGNSVPYTGKLDNLSKHPITEIINKVLKNDAKKAFDVEAHAQFDTCKLRVHGTNTDTAAGGHTLTTDGTATGSHQAEMNHFNVKSIVDTMKERNIPPYMYDDYFCIAHPTTLRTFKNDLETIHQYVDPGLQLIMNGEVGRFESTRFVEQTHIAKENFTNSDFAFFFGEDTVAEAIAIPEEIRGKIPTDFGRSKGIAWYYRGGSGLVHSAAAQSRIVKWDSAT